MASYINDYATKSFNAINEAYNKQRSVQKGLTAGNLRQAEAANKIAAVRGGFAGSGTELGANREAQSKLENTLANRYEAIGANEATAEANLTKEVETLKMQEKMAQDKANKDMLFGILGGIGSIATNFLTGGLSGLVQTGLGLGESITKEANTLLDSDITKNNIAAAYPGSLPD